MVKRRFTLGEDGMMIVPLLLLTTISVFSGFGIWQMLRSQSSQIEAQLSLDQCVGKKALELKSLLGTLTSSNTRMKWVRRGVVLAVIAPEALEAIQLELGVEVTLQEALRAKWDLQGAPSLAGAACSGMKAFATQYPLLLWNRLPPDAIGAQPFDWPDGPPQFRFLYVSGTHQSAAKVNQEKDNGKEWKAAWSSTSGSLVAGIKK